APPPSLHDALPICGRGAGGLRRAARPGRHAGGHHPQRRGEPAGAAAGADRRRPPERGHRMRAGRIGRLGRAPVAWLRRGYATLRRVWRGLAGLRRRRMYLRDLLDEALAGVAARPARLALLTLGTVLGIAALVSTVGIGRTSSNRWGICPAAVCRSPAAVRTGGAGQTAGGQSAQRWDGGGATRAT